MCSLTCHGVVCLCALISVFRHVQRAIEELAEKGQRRRKDRLLKTRVVGITTAACEFEIMNQADNALRYPILLLDEASQMVEPASIVPLARFKAERLLAVGGAFTTKQSDSSSLPVPIDSDALTSSAHDSFFCLLLSRLQIPSSCRRHFPAAKIVSWPKATTALNCRVSRAPSSCAFSKSARRRSCSERSTGTPKRQRKDVALDLRVRVSEDVLGGTSLLTDVLLCCELFGFLSPPQLPPAAEPDPQPALLRGHSSFNARWILGRASTAGLSHSLPLLVSWLHFFSFVLFVRASC